MDNRKKDVLDWLGDNIRIPAVFVSGIFTGLLLAAAFGFDGYLRMFVVIVTTGILTLAEVKMIREYKRTGSRAAFTLAMAIATTSIMGSVGYFQVELYRGIITSDTYVEQKRIVDNLLEGSDPAKYPATYLVSKRDLPMAMAKLESIRNLGAGEGTQLFQTMAAKSGYSVEDVALMINILIALILEGILIYSTWYHEKDPASMPIVKRVPKPLDLKGVPLHNEKANNGILSGAPFAMGFGMPPHPKSSQEEARARISPISNTVTVAPKLIPGLNPGRTRKMRERLKNVANVLKDHPESPIEKQCNLAGIKSPTTFRKYRRMLMDDDQ